MNAPAVSCSPPILKSRVNAPAGLSCSLRDSPRTDRKSTPRLVRLFPSCAHEAVQDVPHASVGLAYSLMKGSSTDRVSSARLNDLRACPLSPYKIPVQLNPSVFEPENVSE